MTAGQWMSLLACVGILILALLVLLRGAQNPLRVPIGLWALVAFIWNFATLVFKVKGIDAWHWLDVSFSPFTVPLALHIVLVFVGRARKLWALLVLSYAAYGLLALSSAVAFVSPRAQAWVLGDYWGLVYLIGWVPPLRDRGEDVAVLAEHFRVEAGRTDGRQAPRLEPAGLDLLRAHAWRGNVRELQNVIERLVIFTDGPLITATDVARELAQVPVFPSEPLPIPEAPEMIAPQEADTAVMDRIIGVEATSTLGAWMAAAEKWFLVRALERCGDNKTRAAKVVGVSRRAFYNKLERYSLIKRAE